MPPMWRYRNSERGFCRFCKKSPLGDDKRNRLRLNWAPEILALCACHIKSVILFSGGETICLTFNQLVRKGGRNCGVKRNRLLLRFNKGY